MSRRYCTLVPNGSSSGVRPVITHLRPADAEALGKLGTAVKTIAIGELLFLLEGGCSMPFTAFHVEELDNIKIGN